MVMYRPQFAFPTPDDCRDEEFSYTFDKTNTPQLEVPAGVITNGIPLKMQTDAPFFWRATRANPASALSAFIRWRDAYGNDLGSGFDRFTNKPAYIDVFLISAPSFISGIGSLSVVEESELYCPAGAVLLIDIDNTAGSAGNLELTLLGVKRFPRDPSLGRCT
jgi:hypothetical protein